MRGCGQHPGEGRLLQPLCHDIPPASPLPHRFLLPFAPSGIGTGGWKGREGGMEQTPSSCLALLGEGAAREAVQLPGEVSVLLLCAFQHGILPFHLPCLGRVFTWTPCPLGGLSTSIIWIRCSQPLGDIRVVQGRVKHLLDSGCWEWPGNPPSGGCRQGCGGCDVCWFNAVL